MKRLRGAGGTYAKDSNGEKIKELRARVLLLLHTIPEEPRRVIALWGGGCSVPQIVAVLKMKKSAVQKLLAAGLSDIVLKG